MHCSPRLLFSNVINPSATREHGGYSRFLVRESREHSARRFYFVSCIRYRDPIVNKTNVLGCENIQGNISASSECFHDASVVFFIHQSRLEYRINPEVVGDFIGELRYVLHAIWIIHIPLFPFSWKFRIHAEKRSYKFQGITVNIFAHDCHWEFHYFPNNSAQMLCLLQRSNIADLEEPMPNIRSFGSAYRINVRVHHFENVFHRTDFQVMLRRRWLQSAEKAALQPLQNLWVCYILLDLTKIKSIYQ